MADCSSVERTTQLCTVVQTPEVCCESFDRIHLLWKGLCSKCCPLCRNGGCFIHSSYVVPTECPFHGPLGH